MQKEKNETLVQLPETANQLLDELQEQLFKNIDISTTNEQLDTVFLCELMDDDKDSNEIRRLLDMYVCFKKLLQVFEHRKMPNTIHVIPMDVSMYF